MDSVNGAEPEQTLAECGEKVATIGYMLGVFAGYQDVSAFLLQESGRLFAARKDQEAIACRNLADKVSGLAAKKRTEYDREYEPLRAGYFARLEAADHAGVPVE